MTMIGDKIADLRKSRKLTQEELANIVGVSAQSVSKWENSLTTPDIMLLPTLASALDVTVNDLFSIVSGTDQYESIHPDKTPEYAYTELLKALQQGLCDTESVSKEEVSKILKRLRENEYGQSGLVSYENYEMNGVTYVNRNIAFSLVKAKADLVSLFDDERIAGVLSLLADANVRRTLKYMLTNGNAVVTAAVAANKCETGVSEAETALHRLAEFGFVSALQVDIGEENPLNVYHAIREYKVDMTVYPLFEIARILVDWHEGWMGFRC